MPKKPTYEVPNKICKWNDGIVCEGENRNNCKTCVWCHANNIAEGRLLKLYGKKALHGN